MSAEFLGPVNRGRRVPRLSSRVRTAESERNRGCCSEMRLCHAGHQWGHDEQREHDRFDHDQNPQRLPGAAAVAYFRDCIAIDQASAEGLSLSSRIRAHSYLAMDAPHSGGTPSGMGSRHSQG